MKSVIQITATVRVPDSEAIVAVRRELHKADRAARRAARRAALADRLARHAARRAAPLVPLAAWVARHAASQSYRAALRASAIAAKIVDAEIAAMDEAIAAKYATR